MTVIAAIHDAGHTWIGSDTQATNCETVVNSARKWHVHNGWAVGSAGSLRTNNLINAHMVDLFTDLDSVFEFTLRMRKLLEDDGYNSDGDEGPKWWGQQMILVNRSCVWSICSGFSVIEIPEGELWADGSGRAYPLGAGHAYQGKPEDRLLHAVNAAIRYDRGCGGEIYTALLG